MKIVRRGVEFDKKRDHRSHLGGGKTSDRLVQHEQFRPLHEAHQKFEPTLLIQGEAAGRDIEAAVELEPCDGLLDASRIQRAPRIDQRGLNVLLTRKLTRRHAPPG